MPGSFMKPCLLCRGARGLCGESPCPLYSIWHVAEEIKIPNSSILEAPSPPSVFVGWTGYPKVRVAPSVSVGDGDAWMYDAPEKWLDLSLDEILKMRLSLVRGYTTIEVGKPMLIEDLRLIASSARSVDLELKFAKPPRPEVKLDINSPPLGPAGVVEKFKIVDEPRIEKPVEKVLSDSGLKASEAVIQLYSSGIPVSRIQRIFSVGGLGLEGLRRIVPTRWSITAVDSIISRKLIEEVKRLPVVDSYLFFERRASRNTFVAIIAPHAWSYEWIEAWFPYTTWNPGAEVEIEGDWEGYRGRTTYASLGGCYYAARLATAEFMLRAGRQGTAILIREIYEGFFLPIGVWFVRENLRKMFESRPEKYDRLEEVLERLSRSMRLPLSTWLRESRLLRNLLTQARLEVQWP
ncbi:MAG: Nre family DNA repair protein [Thermofilaceae archaeon]